MKTLEPPTQCSLNDLAHNDTPYFEPTFLMPSSVNNSADEKPRVRASLPLVNTNSFIGSCVCVSCMPGALDIRTQIHTAAVESE